MIDLHTHTQASDGSMTSTELVRQAAKIGLSHLAVTDHDTVDGLEEADRQCRAHRITFIPGIELSASTGHRSMDILGYGIRPHHPPLVETLNRLARYRRERIVEMVERLQKAGFPIELHHVQRAAAGGVWGRPHVALALMYIGVVESVKEAFERYIGRGKAAFVPKESLTPEEAIELIRESGGVAVLAHPCFLRLHQTEFEAKVKRLKAVGLGGIEVFYSQHTGEDVHYYAHVAEKEGLLATGGSDFHGRNKPDIRLGEGPEGRPIDEKVARRLMEALGMERNVLK